MSRWVLHHQFPTELHDDLDLGFRTGRFTAVYIRTWLRRDTLLSPSEVEVPVKIGSDARAALVRTAVLPPHPVLQQWQQNNVTKQREVIKQPVADLHSKILDAPPPGGPNSFNFMQFLGNFGEIVCWRPPEELAPPPRGYPRSATDNVVSPSNLTSSNKVTSSKKLRL